MKRKKCALILVLILIGQIIITPLLTKAKTIKEFEQEVNKFTADLQEKQNKIAKNEAEVAEIQKNIANYENQIAVIKSQTTELEQEIDRSNQEIAEKSKESKSLFQYLQVSEGENAYLEYVFGATSVTEMVYRMAIVEQLTEYNNQVMDELSKLIEQNEAKKKELAKKNSELETLKANLKSEKERINADTQAIKETMPSVEQQLKSAQANLSYYKKLGCGLNEDIYRCQYRIEQANGGGSAGNIPSAENFFRPMVSGYVNQFYGNGGHMGIDLSNADKTIEVYPISTGRVFKIYQDSCVSYSSTCPYKCNGRANVVKIRHNVNGGYIYSTYAHLSSVANISEGQLVTPDTLIGRMGNTGCSTGAHLHLELTSCDWHKGGGCTWNEYVKSTINPTRYIGFPRTLRTTWNGR